MSHPTPGSPRLRRTGRVALALVSLAVTGLAGVGAAAPATAVADGPCRAEGYDGDASVTLAGPAEVGSPLTATFAPGTDWTADVPAGDVRLTWSATGLGDPVRGRSFTPRRDLVGAPARLSAHVPNPRGRDLVVVCEVPRIDWGHLATPGTPVVTGDPALGATLTVRPDPADRVPAGAAYHFQWFADGVSVGTGERLTLRPADVGRTVTVRTEVTARGFLDTAWSPARAAGTVAGGELDAPSEVSVAGTPEVGGTLDAVVTGSWTPGTTVTYAWEADGEPIGTAESVVLTEAEEGARVRVRVTGTLTGYTTRTVSSAEVGPVAGNGPEQPVAPGRPTISGVAQVGRVLRAAPAADDPAWPDGTTYAFDWFADDEPFASGPEVTLGVEQLGRTVTVRAQVAVPGQEPSAWSEASLGSGPVAAAGLATPSALAVSGRARVGTALTAVASGSWTPGTQVVYTWRADGVPFGPHAARVVLAAAQRGRTITVSATGTRAGYAAATVTSPASARVAAGVLRAPRPRVAGPARVGRRLRVVTGRWTPGTRLTVRWYADGRRIAGASGRQLRLRPALRGHRITVVVVGRLAGYATRTRTSPASQRVRG